MTSYLKLSADLPAFWTNTGRKGRLYEQVDPFSAHQLVMNDPHIGEVQKFCQNWIFGHWLTSQQKLCTYVTRSSDYRFFPLKSGEPKVINVKESLTTACT